MRLHSINTEQRLYVMPCGQGFSCYGFDVLDRKARAVAAWLRENAQEAYSPMAPIGTADHFNQCAGLMDAGARYAAADPGRRCNADLIPELVPYERQRVEVTYPDGQRERFIVGKSTGWMPVHLAIKRRDSTGGDAVYFPPGSTVRPVPARNR